MSNQKLDTQILQNPSSAADQCSICETITNLPLQSLTKPYCSFSDSCSPNPIGGVLANQEDQTFESLVLSRLRSASDADAVAD